LTELGYFAGDLACKVSKASQHYQTKHVEESLEAILKKRIFEINVEKSTSVQLREIFAVIKYL
jgi:hypothetical protein